jgi:hypothetical protein
MIGATVLVLAVAALILAGCEEPFATSLLETVKERVEEAGKPPSAQVAAPVFDPPPGFYTSARSVTLASGTSGASIRYTLDGSIPGSDSGVLYTGTAIPVTSTITLRAVAYKEGMSNSPISVGAYQIADTVTAPTFTPGGGSYVTAQSVTIHTSTSGAQVRYTLDGNDPTPESGISYVTAVLVGGNATLKAIAFKEEMGNSSVTSASYVFVAPAVPVILSIHDATTNSLCISWSSVAGATGYEVYRDLSSSGSFTTLVFSGSGTSCTNSGLADATTYWYRVRATGAYGTSGYSTPASGTTVLAVPAPPSLVFPVSTADRTNVHPWITVDWTDVEKATSYDLNCGPVNPPGKWASTLTSSNYTFNYLDYGTTYYWNVQSNNASGASAFSSQSSFTTRADDAMYDQSVPTVTKNLFGQYITQYYLYLDWPVYGSSVTYKVYYYYASTPTLVKEISAGFDSRHLLKLPWPSSDSGIIWQYKVFLVTTELYASSWRFLSF